MSTHDALWQLVGVGVVWMAVHCAGMCGPLLTGLDVANVRAPGPRPTVTTTIARMLAYQGGRAITYSSLGALAGTFGAGLAKLSSTSGALLAVVLGVVALTRAARGLRALGARPPRSQDARAPEKFVGIGRAQDRTLTSRVKTLLLPLVLSTSRYRPALLGAVLGFLPCMIAIWALGLAALTASALGGALVMLALVALTTPVVVAIGAFSRFARTPSARTSSLLLAIAGLWLILAGLAGAKLIPHEHIEIGGGYAIMLW